MTRHIKNITIPADGSRIEYAFSDGTSIIKNFGSTVEPTMDPTVNVLMALSAAVLRLSERLDLLVDDE